MDTRDSEKHSCSCDVTEETSHSERRVLIIVLLINGGMFIVEFGAGLLSQSTALIADSLDMLADALVYAIGLYALGRPLHWRSRAALTNGILQILLALGVVIQVVIKLYTQALPEYGIMGIFGVIALIANTISFFLLMRFRDGDINMRATWICSRNDMIGNVGVLIAAWLVFYTGRGWPDIVIGLIIAGVVTHSAWKIIHEAWQNLKND